MCSVTLSVQMIVRTTANIYFKWSDTGRDTQVVTCRSHATHSRRTENVFSDVVLPLLMAEMLPVLSTNESTVWPAPSRRGSVFFHFTVEIQVPILSFPFLPPHFHSVSTACG